MFIYNIFVGKEYEGLPEELNLQSKCFIDLLILREDSSPSQLLVIQTEHSIVLHFALCFILFIIH